MSDDRQEELPFPVDVLAELREMRLNHMPHTEACIVERCITWLEHERERED